MSKDEKNKNEVKIVEIHGLTLQRPDPNTSGHLTRRLHAREWFANLGNSGAEVEFVLDNITIPEDRDEAFELLDAIGNEKYQELVAGLLKLLGLVPVDEDGEPEDDPKDSEENSES